MKKMKHSQCWLGIAAALLALALAGCGRTPSPAPGVDVPAAQATAPVPVASLPEPTAALTAPSPEASPVPAIMPVAAGNLAWPTALPPGHQLRPDRSTLADGQLTLASANPADPQDELTITSAPDTGGGFGGPCRGAVTVRGAAGASCSTGAGTTVVWVEAGWRYRVGGGLLTTEAAVALAEGLELVDEPTAARRLQALAAGGQ